MGNPPPDYYQVLEIPSDSSPQQIRTAYKLLAKKWHPDKHPPSSKADAEAKFKAITQAYEVLNGHEYRAGSGTPARKKETPVPKHGGAAPANGFKDFSHLKTMNFAYARTPARDFRTPGRDFKDFYYPAEKPRPGAFMSHSGPLRRKPPPEERKLACTLEELCYGCKKEIRFTRDVIEKNGMVVKKQESHTIKVKPGWKKGTKISFEGLGDERPGFLPADIVFYISEKEHSTFKRDGNDLVIKTEVPLLNALTGWTFSFRHLNGDKMTCIFDNEIIHPGYEKVIQGQGMPITGEKGTKGDLRIKLQIVFPTQLSLVQRSELAKILRN